MSRGDAPAMFILSKVSMLFFIFALAGLLVVFTNSLGSSLCSSQAQTLSQQIASSIGSELNSPLEDERLLVQLPSSLAIGGGLYSQYAINITRREIADPTQPDALVVEAYSVNEPSCHGGVQISYDKSWDKPPSADQPALQTGLTQRLIFLWAASRDYVNPANILPSGVTVKEIMTLQPSLPLVSPPQTNYRSYFISLVKCTDKTTDQTSFLYIQDCIKPTATDCLTIGSTGQGNSGNEMPSALCAYNNPT